MNISFKTAALFSSVLCALLFCTWMFAPSTLLQLWGVAYSDATGLVARRNAALFAGLGLMFFQVRDIPAGTARAGICAGFALASLLLAVLGMSEYAGGRAGAGIASAFITELAVTAIFATIWRADRRATGARA